MMATAARILASAAALSIWALAPAAAQQPVKLRVADTYPPGHFVADNTIKVFMEEAKRRSGGRIDFDFYPAEQLGKARDTLRLLQTGVADVANVGPSYISDRMPLSTVTELPGAFATSCQGTLAALQLGRDGILEKTDFAPNGIRLLVAYTFAPYQLFTTKKIASMEGLAGQKVRSGGPTLDIVIRRLGGTPIQVTGPEIHEAMSRGTIDSAVLNITSVLSYDLTGMIKAATRTERFGSFFVTYSISETRWKGLAPDLQKAMLEAGDAASRNGCSASDRFLGPAYDKLTAAGTTIVEPSASDRRKIDEALAGAADEWSAGMQRRGKPGAEVLAAFRQAVAAVPSN